MDGSASTFCRSAPSGLAGQRARAHSKLSFQIEKRFMRLFSSLLFGDLSSAREGTGAEPGERCRREAAHCLCRDRVTPEKTPTQIRFGPLAVG